ncbi:hypothetical protein HDV04_002935 [Boothiomyces sp. JEL0838]|nr:hypothetical protein HDV04_002935 [Boothiomyces sp. JEL0838]
MTEQNEGPMKRTIKEVCTCLDTLFEEPCKKCAIPSRPTIEKHKLTPGFETDDEITFENAMRNDVKDICVHLNSMFDCPECA